MFHERISLNSVHLLLLVNFVRGFGIDVYIPHRKYQVRPHSSPWFSAACATIIVHSKSINFLTKEFTTQKKIFIYKIKIEIKTTPTTENLFFRLYQKDKSSNSKVKFRQASNRCKRILESTKLAYTNKTKESITSQVLGYRDVSWIPNSLLNKDKSVIPPLLNSPEVLSSASDKAKLFAENSSKNSNLDDSGIFLPVLPSRTNLKLHNIYVTPTA